MRRISLAAAVGLLLCLPGLGCVSNTLGGRVPSVAQAPEKPAVRRAEAIEQFEQHRNELQYDAALSRWNQGDAAGCEAMLEELLKRRPDDREARRLLADVCLERGNWPAAESHLRLLVEQSPREAQAHHSLGLLLEETGRRQEALLHFDRALEFAPDNELYALSRDVALGHGHAE